MNAYIKGVGILSPQNTFNTVLFPEVIREYSSNLLRCIEPAYLEFLNPVMARRMGRVIKMGMASAMICMKDAKLNLPDAIIVGTALGCLGDTEKFLKAIIADEEQFLTPTSFIQSIQNSVSAQIALQLNCTGHNFTFAHKGFSFESALLDALLLIAENDSENILVGGIDEMTVHNYFFYDKLNHWKKEKINSLSLFKSGTEGTIGGEGASFFALSKIKSATDYARLIGVKTIYNPQNNKEIENSIATLLNQNNLTKENIDLAIYGNNGDIRFDFWYTAIKNEYLKNTPAAGFKHLCGEYQTSTSFAMWLGAVILKSQNIPDLILLNEKKCEQLKYVLIYNSYGNNHSLLLLQKI